MNKLMRHIAATAVSAAVAGSAFLAIGGTATAASLPAGGHTPARAAVMMDAKATSLHDGRYGGGDDRPGYRFHGRGDVGYAAGRGAYVRADGYRSANDRPDPWIEGQLEMFVYSGNPGDPHFVSDWHRSGTEHSDHPEAGPRN